MSLRFAVMSLGSENNNAVSFSDHVINFESNFIKPQTQIVQEKSFHHPKQTKKRKIQDIQKDEPNKKRPRYNTNAGYEGHESFPL